MFPPFPSPISDDSDGDGNMINKSIWDIMDRDRERIAAAATLTDLREALQAANWTIARLQQQLAEQRVVVLAD